MSTKFLKRAALIAAVLIMLCSVFCVNAFATGEDLPDSPQTPETQHGEEPQPPEITEEQHTESITIEIIPIEPVTSEPKTTQAPKPTQPATKPEPKPTQPKTTDPKPTKPQEPADHGEDEPQNQQPVNNEEQIENRNPDNDAGKTTTSTTAAVTEGTTQSLTNPDGTFYAYIELNNGQKRMKHRMSEPDYLPEPDIPSRKGFNFVGWYADPGFKKEWDFEKDIAKPGCILYAKWEDDGTDKTVYSITVSRTSGGTVEVNPTKAQPGETINITVTPDEGMRLKPGGLKVNGKSTEFFSFEMTSGNVKITAEFEAVSNQNSVGKKTNVTVIILIVLFVLLLAFAVFMFMRKRSAEADEEDEDGDSSWVDESVVVENGFKNGDKVAKSEADDDDDDVELVSLDDIYSGEDEEKPESESEDEADGE